jgi:hypothetical protein
MRYLARNPLPDRNISHIAARHMTVRLVCSGNHVSLLCDSPAFDRRRVLDADKLLDIAELIEHPAPLKSSQPE